jgi:hypothetical protein
MYAQQIKSLTVSLYHYSLCVAAACDVVSHNNPLTVLNLNGDVDIPKALSLEPTG